MQNSLEESTKTFQVEGTYYSPASSRLDNWTDSRMMLIASFPSTENAWKSSLKNTTISITGKDPVTGFIDVFANKTEFKQFK